MKTNGNKFFLKKVNLQGFRSIQNVEINFQNGLNVIIGKNSAGKTNFLNFLYQSLSFKFNNLSNFFSEITLQNGKTVRLVSQNKINIQDFITSNNTSLNSVITTDLFIDKKAIKDKNQTSLNSKLTLNGINYDSTLLCHGIPKDYPIVDKPLTYKQSVNGGTSEEIYKILLNENSPYFVKCVLISILLKNFDFRNNSFNQEIYETKLNEIFERIDNLKKILQAYTPIENIRFSENFNVFISEDRETVTVNNIFLEFSIDGNWLPFSSLSDGTKRLFYIISEVIEFDDELRLLPAMTNVTINTESRSRIILIEEPELGIHPHQFHKLLEFLSNEAEDKQIIITTHSPQALDIFDKENLDRIIIAYYDLEHGTKLRLLSEKEIVKAKTYMNEEYLSDYWLYSDLEK